MLQPNPACSKPGRQEVLYVDVHIEASDTTATLGTWDYNIGTR